MPKKSVNLGNLRYSVQLQSRTKSTDSGGGFTTSWGTTRTVFANVMPVSGDNPYDAGRIEHKLTHDVYTRFYSNINYTANGGQMRIYWNDFGTNRILSVKYVLTIQERDRWLLFRCTEGSNEDV